MGAAVSSEKVPIPEFVFLSELPFIRIVNKTTAEVRLKANSNCCVRLLLSQEGGTEKRAMDFVLYENTKKTVVLEGLQPEEKSILSKAQSFPLLPMPQPSTFPASYEIRTLPKGWGTPQPSTAAS